MFCHKCGNELPNTAKFCGKCGNKIINTSEASETTNVASVISPIESKKEIFTDAPQPWNRYWARTIDIIIFGFVVGIILIPFPNLLGDSEYLSGMIILLAYVFVESTLLIMFGTTLGKWLLRIKIRKADNSDINFLEALKRSFLVYLAGLGMGIPILSFLTLISSYNQLKKDKITAWDRKGKFTITHGKIGVVRSIIVFIIIAGFVVLLVLPK